jgi:hypothetical protein
VCGVEDLFVDKTNHTPTSKIHCPQSRSDGRMPLLRRLQGRLLLQRPRRQLKPRSKLQGAAVSLHEGQAPSGASPRNKEDIFCPAGGSRNFHYKFSSSSTSSAMPLPLLPFLFSDLDNMENKLFNVEKSKERSAPAPQAQPPLRCRSPDSNSLPLHSKPLLDFGSCVWKCGVDVS